MNGNWFSLNQQLLCFLLTSSLGAADKELILVLAGMGRVEVLRLILSRGGLEDVLGFPRRREGSAALLSVCTEWVKHRKEWDAERGFFSALRYLCCLGYFFFSCFGTGNVQQPVGFCT